MMLDNRTVQRALANAKLYAGPIDGDFGRDSKTAARTSARRRAPAYSSAWSDDRCRTAVEQAILAGGGFYKGTIDGLVGPMMQIAVERWQDYITFDRKSPNPSAGVAKANVWPRQKDARAFYGDPGENHVQIEPPYSVFYGGKLVRKITINAKCAESGERILHAVKAHYGEAEIKRLGLDIYGGCFANRPMRNGTTLSTHAFAAAWDWDPERNQLRENHTTARFARPEYAGFIDAHEAEGWISLGRARDMDWMHFQAVRL